MDGAGKSSAAALIEERLQAAGYTTKQEWQRLGEMDALDRLPGPLRRRATIAALETSRSHMMSTGLTRSRIAVIADRWLTDSLVDLELRYPRHVVAERVLRALAPRADVDVLLEIDAATSARRKPGDWPLPVLERMEAAYARAAPLTGVHRIDATRPHDQVLAEIEALVDGAIAGAAA
jgi:thymidylate kinase